jgi:hypothetical protein
MNFQRSSLPTPGQRPKIRIRVNTGEINLRKSAQFASAEKAIE